jgi:hypothetical protein
MSLHDKSWKKIHIWSPSGPYSCLVRHYSSIHNFFRFWIILNFSTKPKGANNRFYRQTSVQCENMLKIYISSPWGPYFSLVRHYGDVHNFLRFWKISSFDSKTKGVNIRFYRNPSVCDENYPKICIASPWGSCTCCNTPGVTVAAITYLK